MIRLMTHTGSVNLRSKTGISISICLCMRKLESLDIKTEMKIGK